MTSRITILGAGFAGLELASFLSESLGTEADVTLIEAVQLPYRHFSKPGVRFLNEKVTAIDPASRRVTTNAGTHDCDHLVVALGVGYDLDATPGLAEGGNEFYSVEGARRLRDVLPTFSRGRGVRDACEITMVLPLPSPVPPSPETSKALLAAFEERGIRFSAGRRVESLDAKRRVAVLDDDTELPYDLYLGVPKHRAPAVVEAAGLTENGWVPVESAHARNEIPQRLRVRRHREHRHAESRRVRRRPSQSRGHRPRGQDLGPGRRLLIAAPARAT